MIQKKRRSGTTYLYKQAQKYAAMSTTTRLDRPRQLNVAMHEWVVQARESRAPRPFI